MLHLPNANRTRASLSHGCALIVDILSYVPPWLANLKMELKAEEWNFKLLGTEDFPKVSWDM